MSIHQYPTLNIFKSRAGCRNMMRQNTLDIPGAPTRNGAAGKGFYLISLLLFWGCFPTSWCAVFSIPWPQWLLFIFFTTKETQQIFQGSETPGQTWVWKRRINPHFVHTSGVWVVWALPCGIWKPLSLAKDFCAFFTVFWLCAKSVVTI